MLYLTTGANGAGKTLNSLKWVRDRQVKESREVYYNGRFEMTAEFGWKKFDFKDWQGLPDGCILFVDECHNDIPVRPGTAAPPEHIRMLAEHRRRGMDFYLITQHPQNIDLFVRRLIGSPGWHRHLKRTFGADLVSVLEWSAVNANCEKAGAGKDATVSMVGFPKEVYGWYKSASLHTGKKSIPKQVYVLGVLALAIPALIYAAFQFLKPKSLAEKKSGSQAVTASTPYAQPASGSSAQGNVKVPLTPTLYAASFTPRIAGFPQSAPRYDDINTITQAPKPAACIEGKKPKSRESSCVCWTQQATVIMMPDDLCKQLVNGGFFDDTAVVDRAESGPKNRVALLANASPSSGASQKPIAFAMPSSGDSLANVGQSQPSYGAPSPAVASPSPSSGAPDSQGVGYGLRNSAYLRSRNDSVRSTSGNDPQKVNP